MGVSWIVSSINTCAYWFRPADTGGCVHSSKRLEALHLLHLELQRANINCIVINTLDNINSYQLPGVQVLPVLRDAEHQWQNGSKNFDQMAFATNSPLFITEAGTHWADMLLGIRGSQKRQSLIFECPGAMLVPVKHFHMEIETECTAFRRS